MLTSRDPNERSLDAMLEVINDPTIEDIDARLMRADERKPWRPPSVDDLVTFGKYKDRGYSYKDLASRDASYVKWAAANIGGVKGQLCAEALALQLGVNE